VLIILPLAWAYVRLGHKPQAGGILRGISAAVVAIILVAGWRFARTGIKDAFTVLVALLTVAAEYLLRRHTRLQPEIVILACAALGGVVWYARPKVGAAPLLALLPPTDADGWANVLRMSGFFLKVGATLFGSGYVLVSYLQTGLVDQRGWLGQQELLDAVAVGQVTPGPLLTTATFIGYVLGDRWLHGTAGGVLGAVLATAAIFLPSFLLVGAFGRVLPRIRANRHARAALDGMNAAVVALIFITAARFAYELRGDAVLIAVALASLAALLWTRINPTWLILVAGVAGWIASAIRLS
jgi:chromate transporter